MLSRPLAFLGALASLAGMSPAFSQNALNTTFTETPIRRTLPRNKINDSKEFKGRVQKMATRATNKPEPFVYIESGGAAWRGEQQAVREIFSTTIVIPEEMPPGLTKYNYIGLNQDIVIDGIVQRINSDIGLVVCGKTKRGMPFITTQDPTLKVTKATIQVWKREDNQATIVKHNLKMFGDKYYSISQKAKGFEDATFVGGEKVTVSLLRIPVDEVQSTLLLTLKSDDKTVHIRIPRDDRQLVSRGKLLVHRVAAATASRKERRNYNSAKLLLEASQTIPLHEYPKFPMLHDAFVRTQLAAREVVTAANEY